LDVDGKVGGEAANGSPVDDSMAGDAEGVKVIRALLEYGAMKKATEKCG